MNRTFDINANVKVTISEGELFRLLKIGMIHNRKIFAHYLAEEIYGGEVLTAKEVMEQLKISSSTLYRWEKEGKITSVKMGRIKRYDKSEITKLKKLCTTIR